MSSVAEPAEAMVETPVPDSHRELVVPRDEKNTSILRCAFCNCTILKEGQGTFVRIEKQLPQMSVKAGEEFGDETYLTCADCERGPIGFHDVSTKCSYVALKRVIMN
ncbi:unnamed protein product [Soboliphyme baturini]|uniref:Mis18 domain-containing protein n=1 Tax=Soboliphyme baturini TaxID=241478 RepID=A0A183IM31_9BILA|nr:unnamed protein product [Soboliphyme baturini]